MEHKSNFSQKIIQNFLRYLISKGVSTSSLKYYKSDISNFLSWAGDRKVDNKLVREYINSEKLTTPLSTLNRRLSTLRSYANFVDQDFMNGVENVTNFRKTARSWQEAILSKFEARPRIKNLFTNILFNRPNWYRKYHSYALANYIHIAILILFSSLSGYAVYDQVFYSTDRSLAFPTALERPNRFLSFQGRLTDDLGNPETTATDMVFKLYAVSSGGSSLWDSGTCSITPDQDGIFSTLLGSSCGAEIASSVFSENADIWLGVTVAGDAEATPRIQIATVAYALNSETLQGFPAGTGTSTIPYIDSTGTVVLANASPKIQSTSGTFAVEGQALTITTPNTSNGVVTINPDGTGTLDLTFEGASAGGGANGFVNAVNANITSGSLYSGTVASNATGYNFINFLSGSSPTSKFSVQDDGDIITSGDITIGGGNINTGNIALTIGDATTDSITFQTDGSGNGEIQLPNDSIGPNEILTSGQTDEYCLTYEATGTTLEWQVCSAGGTMSSFTAAGDSGANQTINDGNTLSILGGTNGIDTVGSATDILTLNLDTTEIGTTTFGSGSGFTWTFDAGATDPTLIFGDNSITASSLAVTGAFDSNGEVTIADTNIAFDGASTTFTTTGAFTIAPGGAVVIGDDGDTLSINTNDWDITTAGNMSGIGTISSNGDWTNSQATPSIFLTDSDASSDDYSINVNTNAFDITNATDTRVELQFVGDGSINFGDNTATKTIDIGGVTASGTDTINIATNATLADIVTIGNSNAATTVAITGGDDWIINSNGNLATLGTIQTGSVSSVAYSRFGTGTTGHAGNITAADDVLISGDTEIDGTLFLDGGSIVNSAGTQFIGFSANNLYLNSSNDITILEDPTIQLSATNPAISASTTNSTLSLAANGTGTLTIQNGATGNIQFFDSNNTIDSSGNLTIAGNFIPTTNDSKTIGNNTNRWSDIYLGPDSLHIGTSTTDEGVISYNTTDNILNFSTDSTTNGDIAFFTDDLYIDKSTGNVGIGTTAPTSTLEIAVNDATNDGITNLLTLTHNTTGTAVGNAAPDNGALLHMDGTDASTAFGDETGKTWTASGNAQIDTAQSKFGGASVLFDGTGDYISTPDSSDFNFGTGDFTIDAWVRFNSLAAGQPIFNQFLDGNNTTSFFWNTDNKLTFYVWTGGVNTILVQKSWTPSTNTWYHVALTRSGNNFRMFIDGTQIGTTTTDGDAVPDRTNNVNIGMGDNFYYANGWLDEVRITKGTALWTANFTAPTEASSTTGIGSGILFRTEDAAGNTENAGRIFSSLTNTANGSETSKIFFETRSAGAALSRTMRLEGTGNLILKGTLTQSGSPDIAENIIVTDSDISAGDVVMIDPNFTGTEEYNKAAAKKADVPYSNKLLGVISTDPGIILNASKTAVENGQRTQENERPLVLAGRVPVKIDSESEPIEKGDFLTSSKEPGMATKATNAGYTIGKALENWSPGGPDKIEVFVNLGYHDPNLTLTDSGDILLADNSSNEYKVITTNGIASQVVAFASASIAKLKTGIGNFRQIETNLISPIANTDLVIDLDPENATQSSKLAIKGLNDEEVASIDASGNAEFAGTVVSNDLIATNDATVSGTLYADNIESQRIEDIEDLLREVELNQGLLAESQEWNATSSTEEHVDLATYQDLHTTNLFVTGQLATTSLFVSDNFTTKNINSLDSALQIQSLAASPLEIMAGKIIVDTNGDTKFMGNVEIAGNLTINNIIVANNIDPIATESATIVEGEINSNSTAGKALLAADTESIRINNNKVSQNTLVYITPITSTQNKVLYVKSKGEGYFEVGFSDTLDTDVEFNWWIIELATFEPVELETDDTI